MWSPRTPVASFARARPPRAAAYLAALACAGCGSATSVADLPPAAGPAPSPPLTERPAGRVVAAGDGYRRIRPRRVAAIDRGRALAVLAPRERVLEVRDVATWERLGRAPAGAGPTQVAGGSGGRVYVIDTSGEGLLVFETRPELRLTRRLPLLGSPYGLAVDRRRGRLWVTLTGTNELVEIAAGSRPHRLRRFPAVRQPDAVSVDPRSGRVSVVGRADGVLQLLDPPPLRSR